METLSDDDDIWEPGPSRGRKEQKLEAAELQAENRKKKEEEEKRTSARLRQQKSRQNRSESKKQQDRENAKTGMRNTRSNKTELEKEEIRRKDRERKSAVHAAQTEAQKTATRQSNNESHRKLRKLNKTNVEYKGDLQSKDIMLGNCEVDLLEDRSDIQAVWHISVHNFI